MVRHTDIPERNGTGQGVNRSHLCQRKLPATAGALGGQRNTLWEFKPPVVSDNGDVRINNPGDARENASPPRLLFFNCVGYISGGEKYVQT